MPARGALFIVGALTLLPLSVQYADDGGEGTGQAAPAPARSTDCPGRPSHARPIEYKVLFTERIFPTKRPVPQVPQPGSAQTINLRGRRVIQDEADYEDVFGRSSNIDWSVSRIAVVSVVTTYKLDRLESTVTLSEITQTSEAIHIGLTFTQIGPCQGIAQKAEWFSYDRLDYFVLLPRMPDRIIYYTCVIGGCPPGIP
jgi:hypothetical protein